MTKRLHVLHDTCTALRLVQCRCAHHTTCVIVLDVAAVTAAHKRELTDLAAHAGLVPPITLISTSPIQSPLSLAKLGLEAMRVLR